MIMINSNIKLKVGLNFNIPAIFSSFSYDGIQQNKEAPISALLDTMDSPDIFQLIDIVCTVSIAPTCL